MPPTDTDINPGQHNKCPVFGKPKTTKLLTECLFYLKNWVPILWQETTPPIKRANQPLVGVEPAAGRGRTSRWSGLNQPLVRIEPAAGQGQTSR